MGIDSVLIGIPLEKEIQHQNIKNLLILLTLKLNLYVRSKHKRRCSNRNLVEIT